MIEPSPLTTTNPPWKSGRTWSAWLTSAVHAVVPSLVMAATVPSSWNANTSATPLGLGTAGTIRSTPDPLPGLDQSTVPRGRAPAETVTSADALPAVIVTCPAARAERSGGASLDRLTTAGALDVQVSPVTGCPAALNAWIVWVSPTTRLSTLGASVIPLLPPIASTVKATALLQIGRASCRE